MSEKYFGSNDPIGKILRVDNKVDFQVTGVLKNIPSNSHIKLDFIAPFTAIEQFGLPIDGWNSYYCGTYVMLKKNSGYQELSKKITHLVKEYDETAIVNLSLQPVQGHSSLLFRFCGKWQW